MGLFSAVDDYHLTLAAPSGEDGCTVTLSAPPAGQVLATQKVGPLPHPHLGTEHLRALREFIDHPVTREQVLAAGRELAEWLLPADVRSALVDAMAASVAAQRSTRVRLCFPHRAAARLPWEFTYLDAGKQYPQWTGFLALQPRLYLVREAVRASPNSPLVADPLRVLVASADPRTARYPALPHLEAELRSVRTALQSRFGLRVELRELPNATRVSLSRALREFEPHVLHFSGHGELRPSGGTLVLQGGEEGAATALYGEELAEWLLGTPTRLVVLSACHGGEHAGVGERLSGPVPAVVAMQLPQRDASAGPLMRRLYEALLEACPVEEAVRQAREAVECFGPDWGSPVLFVGEGGHLFTAAARSQPFAVPHLRNPHFVGRAATLAEIDAAFSQATLPPVGIWGLGGCGKTQTAVEYAHSRRDSYRGGVFWVSAESSRRMQEECAALGRYFDIPDQLPTAERAMRVRDGLQALSEPSLLILDNVTDETDWSLVPTTGACCVLITSRLRYLAEQRCRALQVPVLPQEAALALLQTYYRTESAAELAAAGEIAARLGYLALALALVAHRVQRLGMSFRECLEQLRSQEQISWLERARRRWLDTTGNSGSVFDAIDLSYQQLDPPSRTVLRAASCFAGRSVSPDLLRESCPTLSADEFVEALAELEGYSLTIREEDRRLSFHELVRVFSFGQIPPAEREQVLSRAAEVLTQRLQRANEERDWTKVRIELAHCTAVDERCGEIPCGAAHARLLHQLGCYYLSHRESRLARSLLERALVQSRAAPHGDPLTTVRALMDWALAADQSGERSPARAAAEEALELGQQLLPADDPSLADLHGDLGYLCKYQDDLEQAETHYQLALSSSERAFGRAHPRVATYLNNLGALIEARGDARAAEALYREALAIDEAAGGTGRFATAVRCNNLGRVLTAQGRSKEALELHRRALVTMRSQFGPRHMYVARTLYFLADAAVDTGLAAEARASYQEAWTILSAIEGNEAVCQAILAKLKSLEESERPDGEMRQAASR